MKIDVIRERLANSYTAGKMYLNGIYFCDTLEDVDRGLKQGDALEDIKQKKVVGQTAIPAGHYNVYLTFSPKFKKQMPLINNVPAFAGVRIHAGNTTNDTEGCVLVGKKNGGTLILSRDTFNALYNRIEQAINKGEAVTIEIGYNPAQWIE